MHVEKNAQSCFGGSTPSSPTSSNLTESYDGTSWTVQSTLGTAKRGLQKAGLSTSASAAGGTNSPTTFATTENFNVSTTTKTLTSS